MGAVGEFSIERTNFQLLRPGAVLNQALWIYITRIEFNI
jgi:hypothetical protein